MLINWLGYQTKHSIGALVHEPKYEGRKELHVLSQWVQLYTGASVADPGCLSRIPDHDFYPSRIPDPKTAMNRHWWKKFGVIPFLWSHKFQKIELFYFWNVEEKNLGQFSKNYRTFYHKIVSKLSKLWVWDPGSGKNLFRIPDPGVKKAPDPGSGSATLTGAQVNFRDLTP